MPPDFNVKNFVAEQLASLPAADSATATSGTMQCIPNLLLIMVGKREEAQGQHYCYCGLYLLEKKLGATGSEGFFRFKTNSVKFDLNATCPMSSHNRVFTSFNHTGKDLYKANSDVANEWKKKKNEGLLYGKDTQRGITVTYSLNKLSGSPAYGITTVE